MRGLWMLLVSFVMLAGSGLILLVATQSGVRLGLTVDGAWLDIRSLVITLAVIKIVFWMAVLALSIACLVYGDGFLLSLRDGTELSMSRVAQSIKDMILDVGVFGENTPDENKPEMGNEPLPPLVIREFVASMRGRTEETLAGVAEVINLAHTGQEIAASEEQVKTLLGELRFDAVAIGLQMRNEAAAREPVPETLPAAGRLSTKSGRAKSYAASEHWRPVWVERYRSMRADETAFRLAQHARRRAAEEN
jgi:hypothetical protein